MFIFLEKITEIILYEHGGPQGCIVYDNDYEGIFLKKVPTIFGISNKTTFLVNEEDKYFFVASDILIKLLFPDCGGLFT